MLRVPREGPDGEEEPGVFSLALVLPPALGSESNIQDRIGRWVAVVGMLAVDADYSDDTPRFHHTIIARAIETLPEPAARS